MIDQRKRGLPGSRRQRNLSERPGNDMQIPLPHDRPEMGLRACNGAAVDSRQSGRELMGTIMARLNWAIPVRSLLNTLQEAGFTLIAVNDGEERITLDERSVTARRMAAEAICSVDDSVLEINGWGRQGKVWIVLGNEPEELAADYSGDFPELEEAIDDHARAWEDRACPTVDD